ncbi:MAG: aminopeptidase [Marinilabiliales bacterium]|nr:MAG: aminopeptidase [Marinilabiliales bacterium]
MKKHLFTFLLSFIFVLGVMAQDGYKFETKKDIKVSSVKNQYRSGTCWSFSAVGFYEAELMRMGKGEYDLSEAFIIRHSYIDKAEKYVRWHGALNFGGGGAFHDVTNVYKEYGIVPESAYPGLNYGTDKFNHAEMDNVLKAYLDAVIENKGNELTTAWKRGFIAILDEYLGPEPEKFTYEGKEYTPKSFAAMLGLNFDDYVEISSFTHHDFYTQFILEVPDNWSYDLVYNVPLAEMMEIIEYSIENGYTVAWAADVSDKGFSWTNGVAIIPDSEKDDLTGTEREKWEKLTAREKQAQLYGFDKPVKEANITQERRQHDFDVYLTTDDHGMLLTGIAADQTGARFYKVKNSWDVGGKYDGYMYASEAFIMLKTTDLLVNKKGIPPKILKKLGL